MYLFSTPWKHQETLLFFDVFRGHRKSALGTNGLRKLFIDSYFIYLFTDWLWVFALRLKDQNLNPLWTDVICSKFWLSPQLHFLSNLFMGFFIFIFIIPVCNYLRRLFRKFRKNHSTDSGRDWLVPSRKCTSWNVELNGNFFARSIFVNLCQCFILCFWSHFVMLSFSCHSEHNTQAIFFHALIFKTIKFKNNGKT